MRLSFCLAIAINLLILLSFGVKAPSVTVAPNFGHRDHFPDGVDVVDGNAPLSSLSISRTIRRLGNVQTGLCTVAMVLFLTSNVAPIVKSGCVTTQPCVGVTGVHSEAALGHGLHPTPAPHTPLTIPITQLAHHSPSTPPPLPPPTYGAIMTPCSPTDSGKVAIIAFS